jgi:putative transcriptional regulator
MNDTSSLKNHFLIAMPNMADPNFIHSVTYICEHNSEGAMGIVINQTIDIPFREVLDQMQIDPSDPAIDQIPVYLGGPVQPEHGFVLHSPSAEWESSLTVSDDVAITTSSDILEAIAHGEGPEHFIVALGYAGWGEGQLEGELLNNIWLSVPANMDRIWETPMESRWEQAAALLGIDVKNISNDIGHA